jgi:amino acid transporter
MDLEYLKKTWEKLPSEKLLDEDQLKQMLGKRTKSLIDRIDRNIKIGLLVLFVLILIFALDDFLLSPLMLESLNENISVPGWLLFLGVFSNALILTTFIYFVIKYYKVRKACDTVCDLKETLKKIIGTLEIYKTMFYLALVTLLVAIGLGFVTGMYTGFSDKVKQLGIPISQVETGGIIGTVLIGLVILVILVGGIFVFLRWGFRKLYGNYLQKLKLTLQELQEIED